jgi:site-specific recombinase XerD
MSKSTIISAFDSQHIALFAEHLWMHDGLNQHTLGSYQTDLKFVGHSDLSITQICSYVAKKASTAARQVLPKGLICSSIRVYKPFV